MKTMLYPFDEAVYAEHGYPTQPASVSDPYAVSDGSVTAIDLSATIDSHSLDMTDTDVNLTTINGPPEIYTTLSGIFNP